MKPAGNETRIIRSNDGTAWGVFLAGGGNAEHEGGISDILRQLNIDPDGRMTEGRSMTSPVQLATASGQVTRKYYLDLQKPKKQTDKVGYLALREDDLEPRERRIYNLDRYTLDTEITGAWSERAFKLASWNKEAAEFIEALKEAANQADLTLWVGNTPDNVRNPFSYMGMIIAITSRMPEEARKALDDSDEEARKLREAVEKTGITSKIEKNRDKLQSWSSGPAYHALSPRWTSSFKNVGRNGETVELKTKHPVVFFLNPARQKDFNHGWFTVEELEMWLKGKGPVIKAAA
tara:strand:- start:1597 stop:2472 length:876 start_codon:yes stop_codon:yes gene_type:complete